MESGLAVTMRFPLNHFPTLGIWWNNLAYPDEDGCRRDECAFEPVPGTTSHLGNSWSDRSCLVLDRKSTRLNSSHVAISYAVFCLKKKNAKDIMRLGRSTRS